MVIAWILLASTGILFARYFKFLLPKKELCGVKFWFLMHRPVMILATALTITGFIIILSQLNWQWVPPEDNLEFAHSVFGIIAVAVSVFQVIFLKINIQCLNNSCFFHVAIDWIFTV
jgi:hypothetical protein